LKISLAILDSISIEKQLTDFYNIVWMTGKEYDRLKNKGEDMKKTWEQRFNRALSHDNCASVANGRVDSTSATNEEQKGGAADQAIKEQEANKKEGSIEKQ
jgi:hypothetical protein